MRDAAPPHVKLKAAGGVRTLDGAIAVAQLGCDRIGASRTAEILDELKDRIAGTSPRVRQPASGKGEASGY
jgi:deoxyribose-phosphate aldolase